MNPESLNRQTNIESIEDENSILLDNIKHLYAQNPFSRKTFIMIVAALSLFGGSAQAENVNDNVIDNQTPESFYNAVESLNNAELKTVVAEFQKSISSENSEEDTVSWQGNSLSLQLFTENGDDNLVSITEQINPFPESGSGVFKMDGVLSDYKSQNISEESDTTYLFSGFSQTYKVESTDYVIQPYGEEIVISFVANDNTPVDEEIITAITDKLSTYGIDIGSEETLIAKSDNGNISGTRSSTITQSMEYSIASWNITKDKAPKGEDVYTITLQPGKVASD